MTLRMKRLARRLLPVPLYNALRRAASVWRLSRVPARAADVARLPEAAKITFSELLGDGDIADGYEKARRAVREILPEVPGSHSIGPEERRALYCLVRYFQPLSILEIGTNRGALTLYLALAMQAYRNGNAPPRLVTLDLFDVNNPPADEAKRYRISASPRDLLARLNCADLVDFSVTRSTDYLSGRKAEFDFIIMDTAASADIAYQDIALALTALRPGGHVLLNSYFPDGKPLSTGGSVSPGAWLAVRRLRREGARLVALPLGRLPWTEPGGSSRLTSLALLARE